MTYRAADNEWNRANCPDLIGREYDAGEAPSYVALEKIPETVACPLCGEKDGAHTLSCMSRWAL